MSDANAANVYQQLKILEEQGHNLNDWVLLDCDTFDGRAIIVKLEENEE